MTRRVGRSTGIARKFHNKRTTKPVGCTPFFLLYVQFMDCRSSKSTKPVQTHCGSNFSCTFAPNQCLVRLHYMTVTDRHRSSRLTGIPSENCSVAPSTKMATVAKPQSFPTICRRLFIKFLIHDLCAWLSNIQHFILVCLLAIQERMLPQWTY